MLYSHAGSYPSSPSGPVINLTKHLSASQTGVKIHCNELIAESVELYMCYAPPGKTFGELDRNTSCARCQSEWIGRCNSTITAKPNWVVARDSKPSGFCHTYQRTTLTIPYVRKEDRGTIYCYYSYSQDSAQVYMTFDLSMDSSTHVPMIAGIASGSCVLILIVLGLMLAYGRHLRRQRTITELINRVANDGENGNLEEEPREPDVGGPPARRGQQAVRQHRRSSRPETRQAPRTRAFSGSGLPE